MKRIFSTLITTIAMTAGAQAATIVIDFEANAIANTSFDNLASSPYVEDGFEITTASRPLSIVGSLATNSYVGSTTGHLRVGSGLISLESQSGDLFSADSIDLSVLDVNGSSPGVTFNGFDANGVQVANQTFAPTVFGLVSFFFSSDFDNIASLTWTQGSSQSFAHQFDNITLNATPVPLPSSAALMVPLAGFAVWQSRRKKNPA